jgi:alpha-glucosidase
VEEGRFVANAPLWWQEGVIYQIYPRSFQDGSGDGVGDLQGLLTRLDYLSTALGVDAVWLSPFYPSPMADFGYDVSNYVDIHPVFGDLDTFDELVAGLHSRNIKIIIDYVPNHTSNEHPWFVESRSSRTNPKRDWYVWADAKPDGSPPNNWLSLFGGSAWEWDEQTGQYYLHSFLKEQPDLNWRNPEVEAAMLDVLRFWLDRGVDGFRIDVAHFIMKDPEMRDNPPNPDYSTTGHKPMGPYDSQLHVYDHGHPDVHSCFRSMRGLLDEYSREQPRMSVGEIHVFDWQDWSSYYGRELDELHMPFNFALLKAEWDAAHVRQVVDALEGALQPGAWPNYVLGNHDEHRIASRLGADQARIATMLLLTLRGTPTLYYGDEIGMHDVDIPPDRAQDPWGKNVPGFGLGRDPERTPMQWDASPNAGFCPPNVRPWLPVSDDFRSINVEAELAEQGSMVSLTRELLALRRQSEALRCGGYRPVEAGNPEVFVYERADGDDRKLVALNFTDAEQPVDLRGWQGPILISTLMDRQGEVDLAPLTLRPDEGCVIQVARSP